MTELTGIRVNGEDYSFPSGGEKDVYTKAETEHLLEEKQNLLVAGDNIVIDGNVISAVGGGGGASGGGTLVVVQEGDYDFWINGKNLNGETGYISGKKLGTYASIENAPGYYISPLIPSIGLKINISDLSNIDITSSKVFYLKADKSYGTKRNLEDALNGSTVSVDHVYTVLSLKMSNPDVKVTYVAPEEPLRVDNKWVRGYWNNVVYDNKDYTCTEMPEYNQDLGARLPKKVFVSVPMIADQFEELRIYTSEKPNFANAQFKSWDAYRPYADYANLKANTIYYLKIVAINGDSEKIVYQSNFRTEGLIRQISGEGVNNARDLGCKPTAEWGEVKQGRIFRSANLDSITASGLETLASLGITVEIDLRGTDELDGYVSQLPEYYRVQCGSFQSVAQNSPNGIQAYVNVFKTMLGVLEEGKSLIFHCKGGADRTGVIGAMLEGILGCSQNVLNKDYETTGFYTGTRRDDLDDEHHWFSEGMLAMERRDGATNADRWANLAIQGGATAEEIKRFREIMLTDFNGYNHPVKSDAPSEPDNPDDPGETTVPCESITLDSNSIEFTGIGKKQLIVATVTPEDTTDMITWETDDDEVATVTDGLITSVGEGSCTITARCGEQSADCAVSVEVVQIEQPTLAYKYGKKFNNTTTSGSLNGSTKAYGCIVGQTTDTSAPPILDYGIYGIPVSNYTSYSYKGDNTQFGICAYTIDNGSTWLTGRNFPAEATHVAICIESKDETISVSTYKNEVESGLIFE